jgi:kinesin family protein 5
LKVAAQGFVLSGAAESRVENLSDVTKLLEVGEIHKRRASTAMNDRSSRAHALFILTLNQVCEETGVSISSRLFLADLGGSEQVKKSKVEAGASKLHQQSRRVDNVSSQASETDTSGPVDGDLREQVDVFSTGFVLGERMREAVHINLGLLALKKCIEALNNGSNYVPFQDSKLTMLLSTGLGGDCKTSIVICGSLEPRHAAETLAALRFGERCALVETEAKNRANLLAGVLAKIEAEIVNLEKLIVQKERWEEIQVRLFIFCGDRVSLHPVVFRSKEKILSPKRELLRLLSVELNYKGSLY